MPLVDYDDQDERGETEAMTDNVIATNGDPPVIHLRPACPSHVASKPPVDLVVLYKIQQAEKARLLSDPKIQAQNRQAEDVENTPIRATKGQPTDSRRGPLRRPAEDTSLAPEPKKRRAAKHTKK